MLVRNVKKETLLLFEIIRLHSSPFEALFFVDHLVRESKEVRQFIMVFSFFKLQSDLMLCVPGTIQRWCVIPCVTTSHACHKARVPCHITRGVTYSTLPETKA